MQAKTKEPEGKPEAKRKRPEGKSEPKRKEPEGKLEATNVSEKDGGIKIKFKRLKKL